MRKSFLASVLAVLILGTAAMSTAEARVWRRGGYGNYYYPGYYVAPAPVYTAPVYTAPITTGVVNPYISNYAPETYVAPGYTTYPTAPYYYARPYVGVYGGWGGRGGRWR